MTTIKIYSNSILEIDGSVVLRSSLSFGALGAIYRFHTFLKRFAMSSYYCGLYKVSIV